MLLPLLSSSRESLVYQSTPRASRLPNSYRKSGSATCGSRGNAVRLEEDEAVEGSGAIPRGISTHSNSGTSVDSSVLLTHFPSDNLASCTDSAPHYTCYLKILSITCHCCLLVQLLHTSYFLLNCCTCCY